MTDDTIEERHVTGRQQQMVVSSGLAWKLGGPIIGALLMGLGALAWDGFRDKVTEGKADATALEEVKKDNDAAHQTIQSDISVIRKEQQDTNKLLKRVARKLKVEE